MDVNNVGFKVRFQSSLKKVSNPECKQTGHLGLEVFWGKFSHFHITLTQLFQSLILTFVIYILLHAIEKVKFNVKH